MFGAKALEIVAGKEISESVDSGSLENNSGNPPIIKLINVETSAVEKEWTDLTWESKIEYDLTWVVKHDSNPKALEQDDILKAENSDRFKLEIGELSALGITLDPEENNPMETEYRFKPDETLDIKFSYHDPDRGMVKLFITKPLVLGGGPNFNDPAPPPNVHLLQTRADNKDEVIFTALDWRGELDLPVWWKDGDFVPEAAPQGEFPEGAGNDIDANEDAEYLDAEARENQEEREQVELERRGESEKDKKLEELEQEEQELEKLKAMAGDGITDEEERKKLEEKLQAQKVKVENIRKATQNLDAKLQQEQIQASKTPEELERERAEEFENMKEKLESKFDMKDYYGNLNLVPYDDNTQAAIKAQFDQLSKEYATNLPKLQQVKEAYSILGNPQQRQLYHKIKYYVDVPGEERRTPERHTTEFKMKQKAEELAKKLREQQAETPLDRAQRAWQHEADYFIFRNY